ncbi:MAG: hypothetical protein R3B49_02805 [Phycisphaerales bacterium]
MPFDIDVVHARQSLDSRGNPTVEVEVGLAGGAIRRAAVLGRSPPRNEAVELRDGTAKLDGQGRLQAVDHVNTPHRRRRPRHGRPRAGRGRRHR